MAIAYVQEFEVEPGDRTTENYDSVKTRLNLDAQPAVGLIAHTAGFAPDNVFRIFDVWETEQDMQRFHDERLTPILEELMASGAIGGPPPREYTYELHDVI